MRHPLTALLVAASALSGCASSNPVYPIFPSEQTGPLSPAFERGYSLERGLGMPRDYGAAIASYKAAAAEGDVRAQNNLGVMALQGRGSRANASVAMGHFRRAAAAGSATARYNLGLLYDTGFGVRHDPVAAAYQYRMAAEMGHALAQHRLAQMLEGGHGIPSSPAEAKRLYAMAAVAGNKEALDRIEVLKRSGGSELSADQAASLFAAENCGCESANEREMASRGVDELRKLAAEGDAPARYNLAVRLLKAESAHSDPSEAARLFTLAARQGYAPAQRQLANMHLRGQAVAKSKVLAHSWLNLASKGAGSEAAEARRDLEALEATMTKEEVRQAQAISVAGASKGR